jgi:hypothetical protein
MIGRVLKRGKRVYGLLWYLYSPGKECAHSNPHLVSGWRHPAELEPPLRDNGKRDFRRLTGLLEQPLALLGDHAPAKPVWHCTVRAAPDDPDLGDGAWMRIAGEIMDRTGLSRYGEEDEGVRWVAVHHGENHIHIVAVLARQDGRRARLDNDFYRIGEACRDIEKEYGLQVVARADRTAADRPTRAEQEKAARAGRAEPPRVTLQRQVAAAAAGARSEPEFFAALEKRGLRIRLRPSVHRPGEITGYAVGLDGDTTAAGEQILYGGGKLAPDLSLPKLRRHWDGQQVWYGGQTLDGQLSLGALRRRWQAGRPGTPPAPETFAAADTRDIFGYATTVAAEAARQLRFSPSAAKSADIAWAAADVLTVAAQATGSPELQQAADGFSRAGRAAWGRIPAPSPGGTALRTAAYLLAACAPPGTRRRIDRHALISALAGLAGAVAAVREAQNRLLQATAAHSTAAALADAAAADDPEAPPRLASVDFPVPAAPIRPASPTRGPGRARRPSSVRRPRQRPARPGQGSAR